jgi:hypothetical protein
MSIKKQPINIFQLKWLLKLKINKRTRERERERENGGCTWKCKLYGYEIVILYGYLSE